MRMRKSSSKWMKYRKRSCNQYADSKAFLGQKQKFLCQVLCRQKLPRSTLLWTFGIDVWEVLSCDPSSSKTTSSPAQSSQDQLLIQVSTTSL
ncbi:hypothetical protein RvY_06222 [Ramazzottius varieornatus]|uniref:Uncharacterized protein n=1 Tax=Ramazzottius varieornatus TaxID=947166 RepID=A0A1D1UYD6_RAMVA|nr:hypothetical protein RvY_06222 [Ramazzottius varieornatus]